jgi:hypothetical protein
LEQALKAGTLFVEDDDILVLPYVPTAVEDEHSSMSSRGGGSVKVCFELVLQNQGLSKPIITLVVTSRMCTSTGSNKGFIHVSSSGGSLETKLSKDSFAKTARHKLNRRDNCFLQGRKHKTTFFFWIASQASLLA